VFRNDSRIRFEGNIHEQVTNSMLSNGMKFYVSDIQLSHLGYNLPPAQMHAKQMRNLELLNAAVESKPNDAYMLQQRAKTFLALGNLERAEDDTVAALAVAPGNGTVRPQVLNYGAVIAFRRKEYDTAIARAYESLSIIPGQAFAYFTLGECYAAKEDHKCAYDAFLNLLESMNANDPLARIVGAYEMPAEQLAFSLGRSCLGLDRIHDAEMYFQAGVDSKSNDVGCLVGLANTALKLLNFEKAKECIHRAMLEAPSREDLPGFLRTIETVETLHKKESDMKVRAAGKKPLVSLSMIVKNEEHTLAACLESVRGVVDEIIIVDTGSTDKTVEIATSYGARVEHFPWNNDFAEARNEALKLCTGSWILYLDADEQLSPESRTILRSTLSKTGPAVGGYICTIVSPHRFSDTESETHKGGYPRIFRNYGYPKLSFRGRVHEQITPSLLECGAKIYASDFRIIHTGYDIGKEEMQKKVDRNYQLLIRHVQEEPLNAYAWFQLGQTLSRMNIAEKAQESLHFALDLGTLSTPVAASAASSLAHIYGSQKRYEDALRWAEYSLDKVPNQLLALNYKAYALLYLGRLSEAEASFNEALNIMNGQSGIPEAGYDVDVKKEVVLRGLEQVRQRSAEPSMA
jgi:glycosyltransferase involved in cell wall biosynthesis